MNVSDFSCHRTRTAAHAHICRQVTFRKTGIGAEIKNTFDGERPLHRTRQTDTTASEPEISTLEVKISNSEVENSAS